MTAIIALCMAACLLILGLIMVNPFMPFKYVVIMSLSGLVLCAVALKCVDIRAVERCNELQLQDCSSAVNH